MLPDINGVEAVLSRENLSRSAGPDVNLRDFLQANATIAARWAAGGRGSGERTGGGRGREDVSIAFHSPWPENAATAAQPMLSHHLPSQTPTPHPPHLPSSPRRVIGVLPHEWVVQLSSRSDVVNDDLKWERHYFSGDERMETYDKQ